MAGAGSPGPRKVLRRPPRAAARQQAPLGFLGLNTWVDLRNDIDDGAMLDILAAAARRGGAVTMQAALSAPRRWTPSGHDEGQVARAVELATGNSHLFLSGTPAAQTVFRRGWVRAVRRPLGVPTQHGVVVAGVASKPVARSRARGQRMSSAAADQRKRFFVSYRRRADPDRGSRTCLSTG